MSGYSGEGTCPKCGSIMDIYVDWKPYDYVASYCYECGYTMQPTESRMTLEEINQNRADCERELLTQEEYDSKTELFKEGNASDNS
jgi:DNA-directed RNA polymerase subunit M/transcription elongation factor TFIIS